MPRDVFDAIETMRSATRAPHGRRVTTHSPICRMRISLSFLFHGSHLCSLCVARTRHVVVDKVCRLECSDIRSITDLRFWRIRYLSSASQAPEGSRCFGVSDSLLPEAVSMVRKRASVEGSLERRVTVDYGSSLTDGRTSQRART